MNKLDYLAMWVAETVDLTACILLDAVDDVMYFITDTLDAYCIKSPTWYLVSGINWLELEVYEQLRYRSAVAWKFLRDNCKGKKYRPYRKFAAGCCFYFQDRVDRSEADLKELSWKIE